MHCIVHCSLCKVQRVEGDILRCWKDDHLQTFEYSLQCKYKGEVTNTTENVDCSLYGSLYSIECTVCTVMVTVQCIVYSVHCMGHCIR